MASKCVIDSDTCAKLLRSVVKELQQDLHLSPSLEAVAIAFSHFFVAIAATTPRLNASLLEASLPLVWEGAKPDQRRCAARQLALSFSHCKVLEKSFQSGQKTHPKVTPILLALRKWRLQGGSPPDYKRTSSFPSSKSSMAAAASQPSSSKEPSLDGHVLSLYGLQMEDIKQSTRASVFDQKVSSDEDILDISSDDMPAQVRSSASSTQPSAGGCKQAVTGSSAGASKQAATGSSCSGVRVHDACAATGFVDVCRKVYVTMDMGVRQEFPLRAGPSGFCESEVKVQADGRTELVQTEVPNDLIAINADSSIKKVRPMKRPAAASAATVPLKRPARAEPDHHDDDHDDDDGHTSSDSVKIMEGSGDDEDKKPLASLAKSSTMAHAQAGFSVADLAPLYYSSSNSAALRVAGGKQVLNLSGQKFKGVATKELMLQLIKEVKQKMVDEGFTVSAAKTWGQNKLAMSVEALRKEALNRPCLQHTKHKNLNRVSEQDHYRLCCDNFVPSAATFCCLFHVLGWARVTAFLWQVLSTFIHSQMIRLLSSSLHEISFCFQAQIETLLHMKRMLLSC